MTERFASALDLASRRRPSQPVLCRRPHAIIDQAKAFIGTFPGEVLYAVKCNDDAIVLAALAQAGLRTFDVASLGEMATVAAAVEDAQLYFMHPVKPPEAIAAAYSRFGVRCFALDHPDELAKIRSVLGRIDDLELMVRVAVPTGTAVCELGGKFGAPLDMAASLLREAAEGGARPGLTFHVGSQCMSPGAYANAVRIAAQAARQAGVRPWAIDVGGGFPSAYVGLSPQPLADYVAEVLQAMAAAGLSGVALRAEPGRALAASGASALVRVELRKEDALYLNDGVYGTLAELTFPELVLPTRLVRPFGPHSQEDRDFRFFGPTCDSLDAAEGPFRLPSDIRTGDWIEVGQVGAYGVVLSTGFNGLETATAVTLDDPPLLPLPGHVVSSVPTSARADRPRRVA